MTTILSMPAPKPTARTDDGKPGRRIEFVGTKSILDEPYVWTRRKTGQFTREQEELIEYTALRLRDVKTPDVERVLGPDDPGLSRTYRWHRGNGFVCVVTHEDADKIFACSDALSFRDLDAIEPDEPDVPRLCYPPEKLVLVSKEVMTAAGEKRTEKAG